MGGNRKHGFMRGNQNGRKRPHWARKFYCDGCQREHGPYVERTKTLNSLLLCNRQYYKHEEQLTN